MDRANHGLTTVKQRINNGLTVEKPVSSKELLVSSSFEGLFFRRYLDALFSDCGRIELRRVHPTNKPQNRSAWTADLGEFLAMVERWTLAGADLYTSLNEPKAEIAGPLTNTGVRRYRRLLFDFDPVRDTGTRSSDPQLTEALEARAAFVSELTARGWPPPALAMSGNGAHAVYRVDFEATDRRIAALRGLYRELAARYSTEAVKLDRVTYNPGRICRLYGSVNAKAGRVATVQMPDSYRVVDDGLIGDLVGQYRPVLRPVVPIHGPRGNYRTLDVVRWFTAHGLYRFPMRDAGQHSVICPWAGVEHEISNDTDCVAWEPWSQRSGYPGWHCRHDHCQGRTIFDVYRQLGDAGLFCGAAS